MKVIKRKMNADGVDACQALVVFSYARIEDALKLDNRDFSFFGHHINMKQKWEPDSKGGSSIGFGCSVYDCSFVLGKYIESNPHIIQGSKCIELGCGPGLCSVVCAVSSIPASIMATDGDEISVELTRKNLQSNLDRANVNTNKKDKDKNKDNSNDDERFTAEKLLWGEGNFDLAMHQHQYDVVLAADVVAVPYEGAYRDLLYTLQSIVKPTGTIWLCYQQRHLSEQEGFFTDFRKLFHVEQMKKEELHVDFQNTLVPIQLFKATVKEKPK